MRSLVSASGSANRPILANAVSLVATTVVTSGLGFAYWWLAARHFPAAAVGFAAATISAMGLLGTVSVLGLGTLLIGELPRQPSRQQSLISTALLLAGLAGVGLGVAFAIVAPYLSSDLATLATSFPSTALFAVGVGLSAATLVLDQALLGLLRGELQLGRNALFATAKLGALLAAVWLADSQGLTIYATWVVGLLVSLLGLAAFAALGRGAIGAYRPQLGLLRGLKRAAFGHHALNLALQAPHMALPVLVTALLSATTNAYFYTAWMVALFVYVGPHTLTTALYAAGARAVCESSPPHVAGRPDEVGTQDGRAAVAHRVRFTLGLALLGGLLANGVVLIGAEWILGLFGTGYAEQAGGPLRMLALGVFPLIVKDHYVAICRLQGQVTHAAQLAAVGGLLELVLAAIGGGLGGLSGLSFGWVAALGVQAIVLAGPVYQAAVWDAPARSRVPAAGGRAGALAAGEGS